MLFIMLSWKRVAKIVTFSGNPELRDTLTPNLTVNSSTIIHDIYSIVDACRMHVKCNKPLKLKQGESINVQDLETNLYWEFGKFTSRDGESLESYYSRFYKMMNELVRNQNEVNEIRAKRLAHIANPLALVAQQQPVYHPQNHPTQNTQYSSTRSQQSTKNRGKSIVTSSAPTYDPEPATVTEDDEMSKEKEIEKLMALISPINRGTGYDNQRAVNVAGARENVGTPVMQKSGIQCYNCKEYRHVSRECQKPKRVKDAAYHKEKMLLCKQEEVRVQLNAEQADWKDDTDDELRSGIGSTLYLQNNNDKYNVFAMENEHPEQPESSNDIYLTEQGDTNITIDSLDISYDRTQDDQDDTDDLVSRHDLLLL
ncbi:retrovirus-related pol polyprotein from transposon TNT 1-94 [Tanacetum coccineum]|uniref:Retrovirus-related pol polyprotein from transposon TNT 1-94 n=1 Tax=Tanacetum coccineum TaxID=301880 RepID=A0ABQ5GRK6_9ASTR